jgi:hypothetical protein
MSVNIKRGFDRIYLVLAALWAFYCVVLFPLLRQAEVTRKFDQAIVACFDDPHGDVHDCDEMSEQIWRTNIAQWQLRKFYSWAWGLLLIAVFVPPIVVYGCCRGAAAIAVWVWKGFRVPSP